MDYTTLVLETDRLRLEAASMKYKHDILKEFTNEVTVYMYPKANETIEETEAFIQTVRTKMIAGVDYTYVIILKETNEFIGCGGVHYLDQSSPEFGIWTKISSHGNHYGFEAVQGTYEYFKQFYSSFIYPADHDNISSIKIAQRLGGVFSKNYPCDTEDHRVLNIDEYLITVPNKSH